MRIPRPLSLLLLLFLAAVAAPHPARAAGEVIWSALIYATAEQTPLPPPPEIAAYSQKLQHIFGYNQFQVLNQHREPMGARPEDWLIPGNGFSLHVGAQRSKESYLLNLQLFQDQRLAVKTIALLSRQSPIFLRGPLSGTGQLIIVVAVQ
ncbi:MAG: hypothetical protein PHQ12_14460 [Chthoniobacteraceae bacterium]|nr:hypothetical protein [Chthoniobacteraceae bacterium]